MSKTSAEFRVLGSLDVSVDSQPVELRAAKQRILLAVLLCHANTAVSTDRLIDALWGERPPRTASDNLRSYISQLRRALRDAERITRRDAGYVLVVGQGELDTHRFEELARQGQDELVAGLAEAASKSLHEALGLWRGSAYGDLTENPVLREEAGRLQEQWCTATEARVEVDLRLGRHGDLIAELSHLVVRYPLHERFCAQLMVALYRAGRQADALEAYRRQRQRLADELGLAPGPQLRELESAILRGDPSLDHLRNGTTTCPYPGLAPFSVEDAPLFFGRERLAAEGLARLAEHRFLAVLGPSGSGKSSLARAGILAALADRDQRVAVIRPGSSPLAALDDIVADVILVDQCEEAFTECRDQKQRAAFFDALLTRNVIITLRADYYGHCADHSGLADALARSQLLVGPMGEAELRRAIQGPAAAAGIRLGEGLTDALVSDVVGQPGGLPLLATALRELWEHRDDQVLTVDGYVACGGVHKAVARLADGAYEDLPETQRETARRVLLRLVTPAEAMVRRRVPRSELTGLPDESVDEVLNTLAAHRLLSVADGAVEIAHEAVLTQWPRLRDWLEEDREGLRLHRSLTAAVVTWESGGHDPEDLLKGARLAGVVEWAASRTAELTVAEREYLAASTAAANKAVEQAKARAAAQARISRRLRWLAIALVLALVASVGAACVAQNQQERADAKTREAMARQLAARAGTETDLDRAMLVALAGMRMDSSPATRGALLSTLVRGDQIVSMRTLPESGLGMTLTPDGRTAIVSGGSGTIQLIDLTTNTTRVLDRVEGAALARPAISPDGRTLAVGSSVKGEGHVMLWDLASGRHTADIALGPGQVTESAWSLDSRLLAVSRSHAIVLFEAARPVRTIPFRDFGGYHTTDLEFAPAGLVATANDRTVVFDPATGTERHQVRTGGPLALSSDRSRALLAGGEGRLPVMFQLDGPQAGTVVERLDEIPIVATAAAWRGNTLVIADLAHTLRLWRLSTPGSSGQMTGHTGNVISVAISPDGTTLYSVGLDQRLIGWDLTGQRRFLHSTTVEQHREAVAFGPDGRLLATSGEAERVDVVNTATGTSVGSLNTTTQPTVLTFSPDGKYLAAGDVTGTVWLWELSTMRQVYSWRAGAGLVIGLTFSPDGGTLMVVNNRVGVSLWEPGSGREVTRLPGSERVRVVAFVSPDMVVAADADGLVQVIRVAGAQVEWQTRVTGGVARLVAGGGRIVAADSGGWLYGWNLADRRELWPPRRIPGGMPTALAIDPGGTQIASTGGGNGAVHLWDAATGVRLADLAQFEPSAGPLSFVTADRLISTHESGVVMTWNLDPRAWQARVCAVVGRELTEAEWTEFGLTPPVPTLCG